MHMGNGICHGITRQKEKTAQTQRGERSRGYPIDVAVVLLAPNQSPEHACAFAQEISGKPAMPRIGFPRETLTQFVLDNEYAKIRWTSQDPLDVVDRKVVETLHHAYYPKNVPLRTPGALLRSVPLDTLIGKSDKPLLAIVSQCIRRLGQQPNARSRHQGHRASTILHGLPY